MSIKAKLLTSFLATLLLLALATSVLFAFRLTLIPLLCDQLADLDCQLERLDFKLDSSHFTIDIGEVSIADNGQKIITNQSLAAQLLWTDLFSRKITLEYIRGHGLFLDGVVVSQWFSTQSSSTAPAPESIDDEAGQLESIDEGDSWQYFLRSLELRDWQVLLPGGDKPINLSIARFNSSVNEQENKRAIDLSGSLQDKPITLNLNMTQPVYAMREKALFEVKLDADIAGIIISSDGKHNVFTKALDSQFDFSMDARAVTEVAALFDITLPDYEAFSIDGKIEGREGKFYDVNDLAVRLRTDRGLKINIHGNVENIFSAINPNLIIDANISSLSRFLTTFGIEELATDLKISATGEIVRDDNRIAIHKLNAGVTLDGKTTQYGDQYTLAGSELKLSISLVDLLAQDSFSLPLLINGGLLSANLDWEKQAYGFDINVDQLPLTVTSQGLTLKLDGRYKKQSLSLDFSMDKDWEALAATLQSPLLHATTRADFSGQAMTFDNHLELLSEELLAALLKMPLPSIKNLVVDANLSIGVNVILEESKLSLANDSLWVKLGSQWESKKESHKVSVDLASNRSSELGKFIRQIRLDIDNAPDTGVMLANLATRSTVDSSKQKPIPTIDKAGWEQVIKDNPWSLSPITIKSDFRLSSDQVDITSLAVDMVGDLVKSHIKGEARFGKQKNDLEVSIDTTLSPGAFALLDEPFSLRGTIGSEGNIFQSNDLLISYRKGTGDLDFSVDSSNPEKPVIKASVTIDDLDLSPLIEQWREGQDTLSPDANVGEQQEDADLKSETSKDGKVIPDMPLPIDWLDAATLDVDYKIKRLNLDFLSINEWQGSIELKDGVFNWPQSKLDLLGGDVTFDVMIDSQPPVPHWQLNMLVENLNPADIRTSERALLDGPISGRIELNGEGGDLRGLMDSLDGRISLGMDDVKLHGANLNFLAPNFLKSTLRILNPFSGKDTEKETFFECSVFHALLDSGVMLADDSILARTKETDILASWKLDLTTEKQIIQAYPKQRATIALPTGELASAIEVSGTLAKPKVGVNTGDLVTGSAKTAFFFVGGWVYVVSKKEWDKRSEEEGACQTARDYWLGNSLAQMKRHQTDKQQQKAEKSTARKSPGPSRRHSRKPR